LADLGVECVDFFNIATRDADKARAWYRDMLGLPADPHNPDPPEVQAP